MGVKFIKVKVELVTKTQGVNKYEGLTSEEIVAAIARHGIIKEDKGRVVKYLMDNKHWSPLDMINFSFEIETSRAIGRQLLRHWSIHPQEHSQRYSDRVQFEPIELRREHPTNRQSSTEVIGTVNIDEEGWEFEGNHDSPAYNAIIKAADSLVRMEEAYREMVLNKVAKETARMFLPEACRTTMTMNGTLRSWLAFLNVRAEEHTQKEARIVAEFIGEALEKEMPKVFEQIDWRNGLFM